jgi:hypothetical protein
MSIQSGGAIGSGRSLRQPGPGDVPVLPEIKQVTDVRSLDKEGSWEIDFDARLTNQTDSAQSVTGFVRVIDSKGNSAKANYSTEPIPAGQTLPTSGTVTLNNFASGTAEMVYAVTSPIPEGDANAVGDTVEVDLSDGGGGGLPLGTLLVLGAAAVAAFIYL